MTFLTPVLLMCLKNLWNMVNASMGQMYSMMALPPYIYVTFTNSVMTRPIHEGADSDFAARVMGRCVGALVVNKLAANHSCPDSISDVEKECISTILGIRGDDLMLLLRHKGAIKLTNMIFFALANIDDSAPARVPSDVLDVARQTFGIISRVPPPSGIEYRVAAR